MAAGWILSVVVWCLFSGVQGDITVTTTVNPVGLLGDNEVELVCTYSLASVDRVFNIAWNRETSKDSGTYEQMALYNSPGSLQTPAVLTNLTNPSVFGRVILTSPTDSSLTAKMRFTSVVCGDERKYQCAVVGLNNGVLADPNPSSVTSLTVTAKPKATEFNDLIVSPSANVEEGQTVTFTCTGNVGRPAGTFLWTRYKGTINTGGTNIDSTTQTSPSTDCTFTGSSQISITTTKDDNDIIVKCALQHSEITDPTDTAYFKLTDVINVYYQVRAPTITKSPNAAVHYEDTTLTLTCTAEGNPAPTYVWWVNGTQVGTEAQLQLNNIKIAQSGDYVCEATNNFNGNTYNLNSTVSIAIETPPTTTPTTTTTVPSVDPTSGGCNIERTVDDVETPPTTTPTTTTTVPSVDPTSGGCNIERTVDDVESTRLYTAGVVMLCISVALLIVTLVLGIFISQNKRLPCFTIAKMEESDTFQELHQSVSTVRDDDERSRYQQLDSANVAGPSVYQALRRPSNDEHGRIYRNDDATKKKSVSSIHDEIHGTADGHTKSYVNMAFTGNTDTART